MFRRLQEVAAAILFSQPAQPGTLMSLMRSGKLRSVMDDAHVELGSMSLADIVQMAFDLPAERITGPAWMADQRFDIRADLPPGASRSQVPEMLRAMLADRFRLTAHHEKKVVPVHALVRGKGALRIKPAVDTGESGCSGGAGGHHVCRRLTMAGLAEQLNLVARMTAAMPGGRPGGRADDSDPTREIPVSDAVRNLGLKLEPRKQAFDTLTIDRVERIPTGN